MSWFGSSKKEGHHHAQTFFPVTSYNSGFGELSPDDVAWKCISNKGFQTETHTFYSVFADGKCLMVQVIWSFLGIFLIPATSQMTFKLYDPATKKSRWASANVNDFTTDGCNSKSDAFTIKHTGTPETEEVYEISANIDKGVQINMTFTKPANAPGCKYGTDEFAGYSSFGKDQKNKDKWDAFVIHRFHPFNKSAGSLIVDGAIVDATGEGMFVHAMQSGMRPNLIAARWNFGFFSTVPGADDPELGSVRAIQMEFETTDDYGPAGKNSGRTKVNIGVVYASGLSQTPFLVVGQTSTTKPTDVYPTENKEVSSCTHLDSTKDDFTGYDAPNGLTFVWSGNALDKSGPAQASVTVHKIGDCLVDKVDVLAEIPYVLRKGLAAVTGTKPYIYQYQVPATLDVQVAGKTVNVKGWLYAEASYVSM